MKTKMINLKGIIKNYLISYPYRKLVKWIETEVLGHLSRENKENKNLTDDEIHQIQDFTRPYFTTNNAFHDFYKKHTGRFFVEYIPDDIYFTKIDTFFNDWNKAYKLDDKCYYDRLLSKTCLRLPETICCCINGFWLTPDYLSITIDQAIDRIVHYGKAFLKKSVASSGGKGVRFFDASEFRCVDAQKKHLQEVIEYLGDNIIIQVPIEQSDALSALNPSSVNTLRVLSLIRPNGRVKICSTIVRMGRNKMRVDNASSGGITCGINFDGTLKAIAFSTKGEKYDRHPDTGIRFEGVQIPGFELVMDIVKKSHPQFPNFRLLSWDFALDKYNEPILVEMNLCCGELDFHQLNNGPVFGDETKEILDEVFDKNH